MKPRKINYEKREKTKFKKKLTTNVDKKTRNLKYIKRSKNTEETQKRLKFYQDKYCVRVNLEESEDEDSGNNVFNQLLSTFQEHEEDQAIESSSEEDEESQGDGGNKESNVCSSYEAVNSDDAGEMDEQKCNKREEVCKEIIHEKYLQNMNCYVSKSNKKDKLKIAKKDFNEEVEKHYCTSNSILSDPFYDCMQKELTPKLIDNLLSKAVKMKNMSLTWPILGNLQVEIPTGQLEMQCDEVKRKKSFQLDDCTVFATEGKSPELIDGKNTTLRNCFVKSRLVTTAFQFNENILKAIHHPQILTSLQAEIFSILNTYQDFYCTQRNINNAAEIRLAYCLHILNHMLKTRAKILHHNAKLSMKQKDQAILPESHRDQGLVRPKILIVLPFRDSAYKVVNVIASLLFGPDEASRNKYVLNYNRFVEEYTGNTIHFPKTNPKPEDYEKIFCGNTDDSFRLGIALTKKSIKLYTDFYSSDILLASPLGLRMIIGAHGDTERDFDFLSSIEILILDQAELFFAQNWDHVLHILEHMHLQPQSIRNTDFSRVRPWCLNGLSKFYRQTVLLTSHELPEFRSLFQNKCLNYRGRVRQTNPVLSGLIRNVIVQVPQVFYKVDVATVQSSYDARFKYFVEQILPQFKSPSMSHCMIYVPSYFDYVRIRNYLKAESISFVQICEYTKDEKIARARDMFFHSSAHFLIYSERAHFFRRTRIKGIRHVIMYQLPNWPHFYSEVINLMQEANQNPRDGLETSMSVTVLYTKYDILQISAIIGTDRANKMLKSREISHMLMTND